MMLQYFTFIKPYNELGLSHRSDTKTFDYNLIIVTQNSITLSQTGMVSLLYLLVDTSMTLEKYFVSIQPWLFPGLNITLFTDL
jgi:hypothetical protein